MNMKVLYENGPIKVLENETERGLFVNDKCQGRVNKHTLTPVSSYITETLQLINVHPPKSALFLGGGACIIPTALQKEHKTICTVVEPNIEISNVAHDFFGAAPNLTEHITGQDYLADYFEKFDLCVLDAYDGLERVPELYNVKVYEQLRDMCGKVVVNFISQTKIEADLHIEILKDVFKSLKIVPINGKKPYQYIFYGKN